MNTKTMNFIRNKTIHFILLMIAVAIFSFVLLELSPIDPVNAYLKQTPVSAAQRAVLEQYWGVNQPLTTKITGWLLNLVHGDLGVSLIYPYTCNTSNYGKIHSINYINGYIMDN